MVPTLDTDPSFETDEFLVSKNTFDCKQDVAELLAFLRRLAATGCLKLDMANGGVNRISFEQTEPIEVEHPVNP